MKLNEEVRVATSVTVAQAPFPPKKLKMSEKQAHFSHSKPSKNACWVSNL